MSALLRNYWKKGSQTPKTQNAFSLRAIRESDMWRRTQYDIFLLYEMAQLC